MCKLPNTSLPHKQGRRAATFKVFRTLRFSKWLTCLENLRTIKTAEIILISMGRNPSAEWGFPDFYLLLQCFHCELGTYRALWDMGCVLQWEGRIQENDKTYCTCLSGRVFTQCTLRFKPMVLYMFDKFKNLELDICR